jgi:hypothetical protein
MANLEELLMDKQRTQDIKTSEKDVLLLNPVSLPQKSDKSATLFDFIKMVDKLVSLTMKDVKFIPEEGKTLQLDAMHKIEKPVITYSIKSREPKKELKPRVRETITENVYASEDQRKGEVWGQKFVCTVQFNIFASVYKDAEEVMEKFEELITSYTGFFKKNGVAEVYLKKHFTDEVFNQLRETLSVRNLHYYVEIEKLTVIFREKIKEIEILAQEKEEA